jgi:hypothetical protein
MHEAVTNKQLETLPLRHLAKRHKVEIDFSTIILLYTRELRPPVVALFNVG